MRLKHIKLSGFKSFVDSTKVSFPSALVAVVGPNGCGKSNIIDAVRWVMGESSAKNLRGESMTDVIFNGSRDRKPVGQAMVELIFENDSGRLVGEFSSHTEISIKRIVTREGQSNYYLNSIKCRKKDITDIFLGTGLGPRSYSIIGQGTVSRIIEAKPEELRVFLEEAAGISKYKERRRETENRIKHTKDNLLRITDLRDELGKQLERLKRQSSAAERYKALKEQERLYKAQLLALRWQALDNELVILDKKISDNKLSLEALLTKQNRMDITLEELRATYQSYNESLNKAQGDYYRIGAEISKLEETIKHQTQRQEELETNLSKAKQECHQAQNYFNENQLKAITLEQSILALEPKIATSKEAYSISQAALDELEVQKEDWQIQWDKFIQCSAESSKIAHVEQSKIQQFEAMAHKIEQRLVILEQEKNQLDINGDQQELVALDKEVKLLSVQYEELTLQQDAINEAYKLRRNEYDLLEEAFHKSRSLLSQEKAKEASLVQLQKSALGNDDNQSKKWLKENKLQAVKRLAQVICVDEGFDSALEMVLGDKLQALCVEDISSLVETMDKLKNGCLTFIEPNQKFSATVSANRPALYDKIKTSHAVCQNLLSGIYVADDLSQALSWLPEIASDESIVVKEGILLGQGWCRVMRDHDPRSGVIAREKAIIEIQNKIEGQVAKQDKCKRSLAELKSVIEDIELEKAQIQKSSNQHFALLTDKRSKLQVKKNKIEQIEKRLLVIDSECESEILQKAASEQQLSISRDKWQKAIKNMEYDAQKKEDLTQKQRDINETLAQHRHETTQYRQSLHEMELSLKSEYAELNNVKGNMTRDEFQLERLEERLEDLIVNIEKNKMSDGGSNKEVLNQLLNSYDIAQTSLKQEKLRLEDVTLSLSNIGSEHSKYAGLISHEQSNIDTLRMDRQTILVKRQTIEESLEEANCLLKTVLQQLPQEAIISKWEEEIQTLTIKITRLGAINLAAIDEFNVESKRKIYLDEQFDDLSKALDTLESAIHKIDKETRSRFKETYEQVNEGFKALFPRLFGGGQAELSLTEEDLLNTGVTVMARPPGKRNSTIHLLSGGEKALTAVALIFAIFQLNPSPFCMLDEVDAPLDDTNVTRFCALVKDMASQVQFIFISHNKVAMEMAEQLLGVTMLEPGVSRIVSVDVDEAMAIAS